MGGLDIHGLLIYSGRLLETEEEYQFYKITTNLEYNFYRYSLHDYDRDKKVSKE